MDVIALALPILIGLVLVALAFDFLNGLHDAANSIATIVSTRVLRPQYAVLWASFFNFVAFLVFGLHVANTIGTGIIDPSVVDATVIFAALVGLAPTHGQAADAPADNETAITGSATGFYYAMRDQPDFGVGVASINRGPLQDVAVAEGRG